MSDDPAPSPIEVQIAIEDPAWHGAVPKLVSLVEQVSCTALGHPAVRGSFGQSHGSSGEISILLADDEFVRQLNKTYRARDLATNVLSFAYRETGLSAGNDGVSQEPGTCLGDVALARETIVREAAAQGKALSDHLAHLLVHGVLHICGFDHESEVEAGVMERLEQEILAGLGIDDPYRDPPAGRSVV